MKPIALALALVLMPACATIPTSPGQVADQTVLDERIAIGVELAYKAARIAVETGVDAGVIRGATATRFRDLNRRAYSAVQATSTAYRAGNAADYAATEREARRLIDELLDLTGRNSR